MAIGGHVLRHVYEDETSAELSIGVQHGQIQYSLVSSAQPINFPDDELVQAICDLVGLHERYGSGPSGSGLTKAVYRYHKNPDGGWSVNSSYSYE